MDVQGPGDPDTTNRIVDLMVRMTQLVETIRPGLVVPRTEPIANFQARVQEQGRIQVPETERETASLAKGDIVQVILWKVKAAGSA